MVLILICQLWSMCLNCWMGNSVHDMCCINIQNCFLGEWGRSLVSIVKKTSASGILGRTKAMCYFWGG